MRRFSQLKAVALTALFSSGLLPLAVLAEDLTIPPPPDPSHPVTSHSGASNNGKLVAVQAGPAVDDVKAAPLGQSLPTTANSPTSPADLQEKIPFKPGQTLSVESAAEDIAPTYDVELAKRQVAAFPDSPEASFILAVAMTRTSRVEEALKEVQRARRLAEKQGGPAYFDKMISTYEKMLTAYPDDNRVRYGLSWAYYMKAYLLSRQSRKVAAWKAANPQLVPALEAQQKLAASNKAGAGSNSTADSKGGAVATAAAGAPAISAASPAASNGKSAAAAAMALATKAGISSKDIAAALSGKPLESAAALSAIAAKAQNVKPGSLDSIPHIPGALEKVDPADVPQIKAYFEQALKKLDEIVQRDPDDVWSIIYRAHLKAEYTGDLASAMQTWKSVASKHPNNPAPYFFLGEGYLRQGNLNESINNVSRAIALRAIGN